MRNKERTGAKYCRLEISLGKNDGNNARDRKKNKFTILTIYGPNENEITAKKEEFWDDLQSITEEIKEPIFIMGDMNARIDNNNKGI